MQNANINNIVNERIKKNSNTKPLYIVRVKDPIEEYMVLSFLSKDGNMIDFIGFKTNKITQKIQQYNQALEHAKLEKTIVFQKEIPWHRVQEIENVAYVYKREEKIK